jgi:protein gp37
VSATTIEWATHVWNPFTGCDRVSPGCAHCYALSMAGRLKAMGKPKYQRDGDPKTSGPGFGFTVHWDQLERPPKFPAGARVFVNSMSDVFHEDAPVQAIAQVFIAAASQPEVDFLILTKRPERMRELLSTVAFPSYLGWALSVIGGPYVPWPIPNVWLGVSIENRRFVHRADLLRETPAAVRFVSAEPLLGPLVYDSDIGMATDRDWPGADDDEHAGVPEHLRGDPYTPAWLDGADLPELDLEAIDWLIVGGESGHQARRMDLDWARDLREACFQTGDICTHCAGDGRAPADARLRPARPCRHCGGRGRFGGTAFFFKQVGGRTPKAGGRELDGRTWDELPAGWRQAVAA